MSTTYLSRFALSDSSGWTTITINLQKAPLSRILPRLYAVLDSTGEQPLAVKIISPPTRQLGIGLPEDILLHSVLKLLTAEMALHRLKSLVVHADLRSSLQEVETLFDEESQARLQRLILRYNVDDTSLIYPS
jgi:hypothetical protein